MDSYDLFGEDGGSSMLDSLGDFGGENLDGSSARDSGGYGVSGGPSATASRDGGYTGQGQPPPQPQYHPGAGQDSPLAKLASFGGDFSHMDPSQAAQQQQQLYQQSHPAHPGYGTPSRPIAQPQPGYQPHMRAISSHRPAGHYGAYPGVPENMYNMDRQSSNLQTWNGPSGYSGSVRHYPGQMNQPQPSYRSHVNYPQQQTEKAPQQYPSSQMMGYQQYPGGSHYSAPGQYDNYGRMSHHSLYQQTPPSSQYPVPQQPQYNTPQGYSQMQSSQMMGYHQPTTAMPRPEVPSYPQKAAIASSMGSSSPQYRAPFPQLSPQISPRPQMSPRPTAPTPQIQQQQQPTQQQQMSPRPVMSPAKPTTHSPHPLTPKSNQASPAPSSGSYPPQSTLQQLEQMVPGYQARQSQNNPLSPALGGRVPVSPQAWNAPSGVDNQLSTQDSMSSFHSLSANEENADSSDKQKPSHGMDNHGMMDTSTMSPKDIVEPKSHEPKNKPHASPLHAAGPHSSPHHGGGQGPSPHTSHPSPQPLQSPHQATLQSPLQNAMQSPHHSHSSQPPPVMTSLPPTQHPPSLPPHQTSQHQGMTSQHQTATNPQIPTGLASQHQSSLNPHQTALKDPSESQMDVSHAGMIGSGHHQHLPGANPSHMPHLSQQRFADFNAGNTYSGTKVDDMYPPNMDQTSFQQGGIDPRMMGRQQGMYNMSGGSMMGLAMAAADMFSHQQEMAALQQQLQELYCMPPAPMHQEKVSYI